MARSKIKNWDAQSWSQKEATRSKLMQDYGIARIDDPQTEITGRGGYDAEAEEAAIVRAIGNDYDIREAMKYGGDVDNKHFVDLGSDISNMPQVTSALRAMQKHGKKELDIKKVNSANDSAQIAQDLFTKSRDNIITSMKDLQADDEQTETAITPDEPYEPSDALVNAREVSDNWAKTYGPGGNLSPYKSNFKDMAFNPKEANPYQTTTDINEFAQNLRADYTDGVKKTFKFKPTIA